MVTPVADLETGHQVAWSAQSAPGGRPSAGPGLNTHLPVLYPVDVNELIDIPDLSPATAESSDEPLASREAVLMLNQATLLDRPAHTLRIIEQARRMGWRIGASKVGRNAATLALLPLLDPDVIELDASVIDHLHQADNGHVFASIGAKAESSGSLVIASGVDSPEQRDAALAAGAVAATGAMFAAPDTHRRRAKLLRDHSRVRGWPHHPPTRIVFADHRPRIVSRRVLIEMSHRLEEMAHAQLDDVLMMGSFQHVRHFTLATGRRWEAIANRSALVVALSADMDPEPAAGVRGVRLDRSDPLRDEWDVIVLTAHFAGVLAARDLGDHGPDDQRRFEYALSYNRELAVDAARALMTRVPGEPR